VNGVEIKWNACRRVYNFDNFVFEIEEDKPKARRWKCVNM
jgi:hypothetical protein